PGYLAPELITGADGVDCRADIYSLGATLYYLATGSEPFADLPPSEVLEAQVHDQLPAPENVPTPVAALLRRMLAKDPAHRHRDWDGLLQDIQRVLQNQPPAPLPAGAVSTLAAPRPKTPATTSTGKTVPVTRPGSAFEEPRRAPHGVLRFVLCAILFVWFLLLVNDRAGDPIGIREATGLAIPPIVRPLFSGNKNGKTGEVEEAEENGENGETEDGEMINQTPAISHQPSAISHQPSTPSLQPLALGPFSLPRLENLARAFRAGNAAELNVLFQTADKGGDPLQLAEARELYKRLPTENELLTLAVQQHKNKPHTLRHLNNDRDVTLLEAVNNTLVMQYEGRRLDIAFDKLAPAERFRLMQYAENTSVEADTALALAALREKDFDILRRLAPRCGALAPVFQHIIQEPQ
ncbi:MAG: protein kinase, partial [Kiritimatiellaeota bacterium]|nr:protein kinase [Kiritimatiellota bacterium]